MRACDLWKYEPCGNMSLVDGLRPTVFYGIKTLHRGTSSVRHRTHSTSHSRISTPPHARVAPSTSRTVRAPTTTLDATVRLTV